MTPKYVHRLVDTLFLPHDVAVAGVSLVSDYRNAFMALARQERLDGLIADLSARHAMRQLRS
ncbi:MAG: ABC transporter substrate-binding protein [Chromatiaceae bacterium]|jgi:ABC-type transporter MlaC component